MTSTHAINRLLATRRALSPVQTTTTKVARADRSDLVVDDEFREYAVLMLSVAACAEMNHVGFGGRPHDAEENDDDDDDDDDEDDDESEDDSSDDESDNDDDDEGDILADCDPDVVDTVGLTATQAVMLITMFITNSVHRFEGYEIRLVHKLWQHTLLCESQITALLRYKRRCQGLPPEVIDTIATHQRYQQRHTLPEEDNRLFAMCLPSLILGERSGSAPSPRAEVQRLLDIHRYCERVARRVLDSVETSLTLEKVEVELASCAAKLPGLREQLENESFDRGQTKKSVCDALLSVYIRQAVLSMWQTWEKRKLKKNKRS